MALDAQRRLASVRPPDTIRDRASEDVEFVMDESTQQLLTALEQRVRLTVKPLEARQEEILGELKSWRSEMQTLKTDAALSQDRIQRYEKDLNRGLSAIRKDLQEGMQRMEEEVDQKFKDRSRLLTPLFGALAGVVTVLITLVVYWLRTPS